MEFRWDIIPFDALMDNALALKQFGGSAFQRADVQCDVHLSITLLFLVGIQ